MNSHALGVLEFSRVLDAVAGCSTSSLAADRIRSAQPSTDRQWLDREHARVAAARATADSEAGWPSEPIPDLREALDRLRVEGHAWSGAGLRGAVVLLRSSRTTRRALAADAVPGDARQTLAPLVHGLIDDAALESRLDRVVDDEGLVRDSASPVLRQLRRQLAAAQGELIRILERALARLDPSHRVADMSVTVRNGRYVIPVRREGRQAVAGIVHDSSATGNTLFIEPAAAVEFGNRIREVEADEAAEVERILLATTDELRPSRDALLSALDALIELDTLNARARFATRHACAPVTLVSSGEGFTLVAARHPLLLVQGVDVVPFDLTMSASERTLLVSGPNTGGKTVLLKAIGLTAALTQSGMPAPVGRESRLPAFDDIFADIGDEQSIEASLSTFSAHLKNLGEILDRASSASLVLIDELGSGTDPVEGAALGSAILEELATRGTITVVTTHLGSLKELAGRQPAVVNASLQFDTQLLAPTYRLIKGVPGRSYGIAIAQRLRLPARIIARAEAEVPEQERQLTILLDRIEKRDEESASRERELTGLLEDVRRRLDSLDQRERGLRDRERGLEREGRAEARRYVLEARARLEQVIAELRSKASEPAGDAARAARKEIEGLVSEHAAAMREIEREEPGRATPPLRDRPHRNAEIGDRVEIAGMGGSTGRVLEWRDGSAIVAIGALKVTVPRSDLVVTNAPEDPTTHIAPHLPDSTARTEIDVRGMRATDAQALVLAALDSAVRDDLGSLRIIHGKGTGALRATVADMLKEDRRVKSFRLGAWNEGGAGVTIVDLE